MARVTSPRLQMVIAVDTKQTESGLNRAEHLIAAFSGNVTKSANSAIQNLEKLRGPIESIGLDFDKLSASIRKNLSTKYGDNFLLRIAKDANLSAAELQRLAEKAGSIRLSMQSFSAASADMLGFRTTKIISEEIKKLGRAYRVLAADQTLKPREIEAAQQRLITQVRTLTQEYKTLGMASKNAQSPSQIASSAAKTLGFTTRSDIAAQIREARKAFSDLRQSGVVSAADIELAQKRLSEHTRGLIADYRRLAGIVKSTSTESAASTLGLRTRQQISVEIKKLGESYTYLKNSGTLSVKEIEAAQQRLISKTRELAREYKNLVPPQSLSERFKRDAASANALGRSISMVKTALAGYVSVGGLGSVARTAIEMASIEKTFFAVTGSAQGARAEIRFLREEAQRLGLDFFALAGSFKGFSSAGKVAGLSAKQVRNIFLSVSEASTIFGLSAERTKLVMYSLEQMVSKGVVSMEELRRQLGEHLPGAFQYGALAMRMSVQEFAKLVESGQLFTADFLPKFAKVLKEKLGHGLAEAMKTPRAEIQRLMNSVNEAKILIGEGGFLQGLAQSSKELRSALETDTMQANLQQFGYALGKVTGGLSTLLSVGLNNSTGILALGAAFGTATIASRTIIPVLSSISMELLTMPSRMAGIRSAAGSMLAAVGGKAALATGGLAALAGLVAYLSMQQSEGERYAAKYASSIAAIAAGGEAATGAIENIRAQVKELSKEMRELEVVKLKTSIDAIKKDFQAFAAKEQATRLGLYSAIAGGATSGMVDEVTGPFTKAIEKAMKENTLHTQEFRDEIAKIGKETGLIDWAEKITESSKSLNEATVRLGESTNAVNYSESIIARVGKTAGEVAESFANMFPEKKLMQISEASKLVAELSDSFSRLSLTAKEFAAATLSKEVSSFTEAIKALAKAGRNAESSIAQSNLNILSAGAAGFGAEKIRDWVKERAELSKELKKIEKGEVEYNKLLALEKYKAQVEGLRAEKLSLEAQITIWEARVIYAGFFAKEEVEVYKKRLEDIRGLLKETDDTLAKTEKYSEELQKIYSGLGGTGGGGPSRLGPDLSTFLRDAEKSTESLALKYADLMAQLRGSGLHVELQKITASYQEQFQKIEEYRGKYGKDPAIIEQLRQQKEWLEKNKELEAEIARINDQRGQYQTRSDYGALIGDLRSMYDAKAKLYGIDLSLAAEREKEIRHNLALPGSVATVRDMEQALSGVLVEQLHLRELLRREEARRDMNIPGMIKTGMMEQARETAQGYIDFFEKEIPGAFSSAADSFGTFVANIGIGTKNIGDAWSELGKSLNNTIHKMLADLTSLYMKMALFGDMEKSGKAGGLIGMLGGAIGSLFSSPGINAAGTSWTTGIGNIDIPSLFAQGGAFVAGTDLAAYRNSIVNSPTFFAFAKGGIPGVGLMGEKSGSPGEAIMPLARTRAGDLGVNVAGGIRDISVQPQVTINVVNNTPAQVSARTSQDPSGAMNVEILVNDIENRLAQRVMNGRSRLGAAMDRTRGLNRASALYS